MAKSLALIVPLASLAVAGIFVLSKKKKKSELEDNGAFIERFEILPPPPPPPPAAPLPLTGLTFAVKDIFEIEGQVTGFGNPDWKATHGAAQSTAPVVEALIQAGATCIGRTHMDELAFSINGENVHYGTPVNPAAPRHCPGGSSSGSAVAVAANLADFALGTDTGGSVRIPAAYCGILGFRPSHGVVSTSGVLPMAPSLDTVGWFARSPQVLRAVGHLALQQPYMSQPAPQRILIGDDLFDLSNLPRAVLVGAVASATENLLGKSVEYVKVGERLAASMASLKEFYPNEETPSGSKEEVAPGLQALTALKDAFRVLQGYEFRMGVGDWVEETKPNLADDISDRVAAALACEPQRASLAQKIRGEARQAMNRLLEGDAILVLPTAPGPPPKLQSKGAQLEEFRTKAFLLLSIAGMSGCPQVHLPAGTVDGTPKGLPSGVSLMARHGADRFLLEVASHYAPAIAEKAQALTASQKRAAPGSGSGASAPSPRTKANGAEIAKEKGNQAFKLQDYDGAVSHYSHAIRLDPKNALYYNNRAMAYLKQCKFQEAEEDCTLALELDKKNVKALLRRGTAREFLGFYAEAIEDFNKALVLEPNNRQAVDALQKIRSSGIM